MIIHRDIKQGTKQWAALRAGIPTCSRFSNIMTAGRKKSEQRHKYLNHLLGERMLGERVDGFVSQYMAQGNQLELRVGPRLRDGAHRIRDHGRRPDRLLA